MHHFVLSYLSSSTEYHYSMHWVIIANQQCTDVQPGQLNDWTRIPRGPGAPSALCMRIRMRSLANRETHSERESPLSNPSVLCCKYHLPPTSSRFIICLRLLEVQSMFHQSYRRTFNRYKLALTGAMISVPLQLFSSCHLTGLRPLSSARSSACRIATSTWKYPSAADETAGTGYDRY